METFFWNKKALVIARRWSFFSFSIPILLGSNARWFMDNTFLLKIRKYDLIEVILCLIRPKLLNSHFKLCFDYFVKIGKYTIKSDFCLKRNNQVTWTQSSINEANHLKFEILGIVVGPQTSLWTNAKGIETLLLLIGKEAWQCFASSQISQCNFSTSIPYNKGNIILRMPNDGCLRRWWWSQILSFVVDGILERNDECTWFSVLLWPNSNSR